MSDKARNSKFRTARREVIQARTQLLKGTADEITALLKETAAQITTILAAQPSDYQRWYLPQLKAEIERVLRQFGVGASATLSAAAGAAWEAGQTLVDEPITAGGIRLAARLPSLNPDQLIAMKAFMTDRIRNISTETAGKIGGELGLVVIGGQSPGDAITNVQALLESPRKRAITIVRTEIGRAFATATQQRMVQAGGVLPGLGKQWRRSGKIHSRIKHDLTDGQVRPVALPFILGTGKVADENATAGTRIMHPHDPTAPPAETINCGCVSLPHMTHWDMASPGKKAFTDLEIAFNPTKQEIAEPGKTIAELLDKA